MAIPQETLDNWFEYHQATLDNLSAYDDIRKAARVFAELLNSHVPDSADKTAAIRKLREVVWTAISGIACGGK